MRIAVLAHMLALAAALVAVGASGAASAGPQGRAAEPAPVASLEPAKTAKLWQRLVSARARRAQAPTDCRPLRAVFYAPTDWLRLATKLASAASPCAEYYVSVPPLVADKTQPRRDAAWRIRALGPNFHAMAEFHFTTWSRWVQSTGSSWYEAGITARQRMAAAGYDFAAGDSWMVNEASSAVRRGTGSARTILRDLTRGLYEGDGTMPTRGSVLVIGVGQQASDVSLYQTNLQNWFTDTAFWTDMATYVSDWSQEVYGDVRNFAVAGVATGMRRDYLNDYLQHEIVLAGAGPPTIETARAFLAASYSPLANAAWEREAGYGWTMVPPEQMAAYVSAQVNALRYFSATSGQPQDRWGFAWAPRNGGSRTPADFATQSGLVLDRLAAAVRDSAQTPDPADPGGSACGPPGQNLYCAADVAGARLTEAWKSFRGWTQSVLAFAAPPQTLPAGAPSGGLSLALTTGSGLAVTTPTPLTVTLSSTSRRGTFSTTPAGPWSPTLTLTIPAGSGTTGVFYYLDTRAGESELTATAAGATSGVATVTVTPGAPVRISVRPASATVRARTSQVLRAVGGDTFGNTFPVSASWSLAPVQSGALAPRAGASTTFTADRLVGPATITAAIGTETGTVTAAAQLRVSPGQLKVGPLRYQRRKGALLLTIRTLDTAGRPISRAAVSVLVKRGGRTHFTARGTTGAAGKKVYRIPARKQAKGRVCFTTVIRRVAAPGFVWDGRTPGNRFCT